jgi:predicted DNA binding CopG/RHH family protein
MEKYSEYEKDILESYENDEWYSSQDLKSEKKKYSQIARNTILKNKRINIRISERDLTKLKSKSVEEGIPYQTLVSSILHKFVSGKIIVQN